MSVQIRCSLASAGHARMYACQEVARLQLRKPRFETCWYTGDIHGRLRGTTGHARPADGRDDPALAGLWAFQPGGEGDVIWVRASDLRFIRRKSGR